MLKPLRPRTLQRDQTFQTAFGYLVRVALEEAHHDLTEDEQQYFAQRMSALMDRLVLRLHRQHRLPLAEALDFVRKLFADTIGSRDLADAFLQIPIQVALGEDSVR